MTRQLHRRRSPRPAGATDRADPGAAHPRAQADRRAAHRRPKPGRDRYLDLLRSIALVRVVVYHLFGWAWLTVLFPSMGVMFALAGSLMARSLDRPALGVIRGRVRRLLPPMWAFARSCSRDVLVGWKPVKEDGGTWCLVKLVNYIVPSAPRRTPGSAAPGRPAGAVLGGPGRGPALVPACLPVVRARLTAAAVGVPQGALGDAARAAGR